MVPEERPDTGTPDPNSPARRSGSGRLATVRADFFLNPAERLTEQERALMTAMLHFLVGEIADELGAALPAGWVAANDESHAALVDRLAAANLLDEPALMALLLRRADEERIASGAKARSGRRDARALQGLVSHEDGAVSAAAMALILARGRRRDRFGQYLLAVDDLAPATAEQLVHSIAAALREELATSRGSGEADAMLVEASREILALLQPQRGTDALTAALVDLLDEGGALSDELLVAAANEGEIAFVAHAFARRGGIPAESAIDELLSVDARRIIALLRVAGTSRELSAGLLAAIGDLLGISDSGEAIGMFDRMTDEQASAARAWLSTAPGYRSALEALGEGHGKRS
jgi:Uncharacterised protein conserved in bacteria (DUF2336)